MVWTVLFLALLAIMFVVLWPFLRPNFEETPKETPSDWTRQSLKAALAAVDKDEARGVLSGDAADSQRADIAQQAELAFTKGETGETDENTDLNRRDAQGRAGFICVAGILLLAPVLLWGGYMHLGTKNPQDAERAALKTAELETAAQQTLTIEAAVLKIEARLKEMPEEGLLWAALGDLKNRQADYVGAEAAFEQALRYSDESSEGATAASSEERARLWLVLAMTRRTQGRPLSDPSVVAPLKKSLELDPSSPAAILLARIQEETP